MLRQHHLVVVAAVIEKNGQILIGQRRRGDSHAFKWEFPGGKVEEGEQPREALQRELEEELSIQAHVGPELTRFEYRYPRKNPILLIFHRITDFKGDPLSTAFEQIKWEAPQHLLEYDFLDGDVDFIRRLSNGEFR